MCQMLYIITFNSPNNLIKEVVLFSCYNEESEYSLREAVTCTNLHESEMLGSRWHVLSLNQSSVFSSLVFWAGSHSPILPKIQDRSRSSHLSLGSFTAQLLAGTHCPGLYMARRGNEGRNQGWRWEMRKKLC